MAPTSRSARPTPIPKSPSVAGPQLVVPISNARYALNAANARWGSLYDALYGTDALSPPDPNAQRLRSRARRGGGALGARLPRRDRAAARRRLEGCARFWRRERVVARRCQGWRDHACRRRAASPAMPATPQNPSRLLLVHNGLHAEIVIDRNTMVGRDDPAGISDVDPRIGAHHHSGLRGFRRRRRSRRQGAGLSQLARPDEGRAVRHLRKARRNRNAHAASRPRILRAGRKALHAAGPRAAAHPQCRPSHDHRPRNASTATRRPRA